MLKARLLHGIRKRMARLKTGQRQISDVFKNDLECGKNIAIHPLVETTWLLQVLYPQVKMSIENQLEHEG